MKRYRLSPEAQQDIQEIRAYCLKEADARIARHVLGEIEKAFQFLATTPGAGHARADLTDEPVKFWAVLSYLVVYDPRITPVSIARVLHGRRDIEAMLRR